MIRSHLVFFACIENDLGWKFNLLSFVITYPVLVR